MRLRNGNVLFIYKQYTYLSFDVGTFLRIKTAMEKILHIVRKHSLYTVILTCKYFTRRIIPKTYV